MSPTLQTVFDFFSEIPLGIIGSAVRYPDLARDIDTLTLISIDFEAVCKSHGIRRARRREWHRGPLHLKVATFRIPGIRPRIQLSQVNLVAAFDDHPYAVLLRDGTLIHDGCWYAKPLKSNRHTFPVR